MINPSLMESHNVSTPRLICFSDVYFCRLCTSYTFVLHDLFESFDLFVCSLLVFRILVVVYIWKCVLLKFYLFVALCSLSPFSPYLQPSVFFYRKYL